MTLHLTHRGPIIEWRGPAPYWYVVLPADHSSAIRAIAGAVTYGWGVIPVRAQLGATTWHTSLFPKDGRYLLPIRRAVQLAERLALGDTVDVTLDIG